MNNEEMLSYHNDSNFKDMVVGFMKDHQLLDDIIKGSYGETEYGKEFKGCAVGCTINSINKALGKSYDTNNHKVFEESMGIPTWLAAIQEEFFEVLPCGHDSQFAIEFLESIPVGVNLDIIQWKFYSFIIIESIEAIKNKKNLPENIKQMAIDIMNMVLHAYSNSIIDGKMNYRLLLDSFFYIKEKMECPELNEAKSQSIDVWTILAAMEHLLSLTSSDDKAAEFRIIRWTAKASAIWPSATGMVYKKYAAVLMQLLKEAKKYEVVSLN